jgi:hypothetical protein
MKFDIVSRSLIVLIMIISPIFLITSCDKAGDLLLTDSEKLMKDLKGSYNLVSVRHEDLASNDGGNTYNTSLDTTYSATGSLELSSVDKADYTGMITIQYQGYNETHSINGSASAGDYDKLWIITDNGEDISCMILFNPPASYLQGWLDENDDNHILLRISETAVDYSAHKNRFFRFEKAK